ncbi:MAG: hypothetical protein ICV83_23715, partial [Cytophagales bacterium]|nr:hypothetical protein [Cytophagales bacterium]
MSGIFPEANTLEEFYHNLIAGKDSVREMPDERKIFSAIDPAFDYQLYGFLDRVDTFDYKFFNISKAEADLMDPQQRLLLQLTCNAIEDAGYSLQSFSGTRTGVFMSAKEPMYKALLPDDSLALTGNMAPITAGRIAYVFNLLGTALMIDTACSSSLVAVVEACKNLLLGTIDCAVVGGISISSFFKLKNSKGEMGDVSSPDGKCRSFDEGANGTIGGEGGGVIILKLLDRAEADQDNLHAIIKGFASNQDGGRKVGITAPSPQAQTQVLLEAWKNADINPELLTYVEAHGTGTRLGDPIEIRGMTDAFKAYTDKKGYCAVSTVKTNIGHLDAAAGITGLIKVVLALKHRKLFPSLHYQAPNPLIDFKNSAVYVNAEPKEWDPVEGKYLAGVSSFGLSGTNAHVVLENAPARPAPVPAGDEGYVLKISAKTPASLNRYLWLLKSYLADEAHSVADVCYTFNTGRDDFEYRRAFVARDRADLLSQLEKAGYDQAVEKTPPAERELVVLLSGSTGADNARIDELKNRYAVFKEKFEACEKLAPPANEQATAFAVQYALLGLLQAHGLDLSNAVGTGVSNLVTAVFTGRLSLEAGLAKAAQFTPQEQPPDSGKLNAYLDARKSPLCLDLGDGGVLYAAVKNHTKTEVRTLFRPGEAFEVNRLLAELYLANVPVDWKKYYGPAHARKISAPVYPFEANRCWYRPELKSLDKDVTEWFYDVSWTRYAVPTSKPLPPATWLVLGGRDPLGPVITTALRAAGHRVVAVWPGEAYEECDENTYRIDPAAAADYDRLRASLAGRGVVPGGIIHVVEGTNEPVLDKNSMDAAFGAGLFSLFLFTQAFDEFLRT